MISIKGLDKAEVLKALYDHSHVQGYGFLQAVPDGTVTVEHCKMLLENTGYPYFDYLYGRVIKVDLSGDEFDERLYDRDCGTGAAQRAVDSVRRANPMDICGSMTVRTDKCLAVAPGLCDDEFMIRFRGIDSINAFLRVVTKLRDDMVKQLEG